jgi:DNA replication protein DnaC
MKKHCTCPECGKKWDSEVPDTWVDELCNTVMPTIDANFKPREEVTIDINCHECQSKLDEERLKRECAEKISYSLSDSRISSKRLQWDNSKGNLRMEQFIGRNMDKSLFIADVYGSNKTWCVCHMAHEWIKIDARRGRYAKIRFWLVADLLAEFAALYYESCRKAEDLVDELKTCHLLILDDFGKEKLTDRGGEALFRIINSRYENELPVWITSNFNGNELMARMGDRGEAIVRRLKDSYLSWHQHKAIPSKP